MEQENDQMTQTSKISFKNMPIFWNFIELIMQNLMLKLLHTKAFSGKLWSIKINFNPLKSGGNTKSYILLKPTCSFKYV